MLSKDIKIRRLRSSSVSTTSSGGSASIRAESGKQEIKTFMKRYAETMKDPGLNVRDWLVIIAELFVSLAWLCIRQRRRLIEELKKRGMTEREETIDFLFWEGWVAVGSLFVGYFIDSHDSYYKAALFSVIFHFFVTSFIFMEETIMLYERDNPYSDVIAVMVTISILVAKSTDFTRYDHKLVFGLRNLRTKEHSKVVIFLFMFMWVGEKVSDGGLLWTVLHSFKLDDLGIASIAFLLSGVSFYLYVFPLKPVSSKPGPSRVISLRIIGCVVSALYRKLRHRKLKNKSSWLDYADRRYDKRTVFIAKELLRLFQKLSPTIGYALYFTSISEYFIQDILTKLKPTGLFYYMGFYQGMRLSMLLSMLVAQFVIVPFLTVIGVSNKFHIRFLIGYVAALISMFYTAIALTAWSNDTKFSFSVGHVRIFNVRDAAVNFSSREMDFTQLNFTVKAMGATSLQFSTSETKLFRMAVRFESSVSWTTHLSVNPMSSTGYILTDPPYVMRIGELPVEEGPPGTNNYQYPRVYLFNSVRNKEFPFVIKNSVTNEQVVRIVSRVGVLHVFQLPEGKYELVLINMDKKMVRIGIGGVYGIIIYSDGLRRHIAFDETIPENVLPSSYCIGFVVPASISLTFAYVSLQAIALTSAPMGLLGISFGFLTSIEYLTTWILYAGYKTWHPYPKAQTLYSYGFCQTFFLFISMFVFVKYKDAYSWKKSA